MLEGDTPVPTTAARRRGLGPFSGGQLTAIIIAVVIAVGFPIGAFATLSFSNVSITDPHGVYRAYVNKSGQLEVNANGAVAPAIPAHPIAIPYTFVPTTKELRAPQTRRFGITSLTVFNSCNALARLDVYITRSTGPQIDLAAIIVGPTQMTHLTYPAPLVATPPAGGSVSLSAVPNIANCFYISGVGIQS